IVNGIPNGIVGTVQYTDHVLRPLLEYTLQTKAVFWSANLLGVRRTHGRNHVGEHKSSFEKVNLPVKLQTFAAEKARIEIQKTPMLRTGEPLITQIVHRQNCSNRSKARIALRLCLEKCDRERCLPIMRMEDIGNPDLSK